VNPYPHSAISPDAHIGRDVKIGPFSLVERDVVVGDRCVIESHVTIKQGTRLGADNHVFDGAVLGATPQHIHIPRQTGALEIGSRNTIRENATIHRALNAGQSTTLGDDNLLMINAHVAHDCQIGNRIILANNVLLAGHVEVHDDAYLSGAVGVHQFCRIGSHTMVGGQARVVKDVPPFVTVDGVSGMVVGLNLIGLRRKGFDTDQIKLLKAAYQVIYRSGLRWTEVVDRLAREFRTDPAVRFHQFCSVGARGFVQERRTPRRATLKMPAAQFTPVEHRKAG